MSETDAPLAEVVAERLEIARDRIAHAGGDPDRVKIIAVTKALGPEAPPAAFAVGLRDFGENYADGLVSKWGTVGPEARWHFIGALQRNKVGRLVRFVDCWQTLSRIVEGEAIRYQLDKLAQQIQSGLGDVPQRRLEPPSVLVEVDTTGLAGRGGCSPEEVPQLVVGLQDVGCRVEGLMTVAPPGDARLARAAFDKVADLRDKLGLKELSMGMSGDLEQAVAAGATMVRLGTALFGPRPQSRGLQQ
jgi:hypothetical protein